MPRYAAILALLPALSLPAVSAPKITTTSAMVYELGTNREHPLFRYERREFEVDGDKNRIESVFTDLQTNERAFIELVEEQDGHVLSYEWTHFQMGESGKVEVENGTARYRRIRNGSVKTDDEDAPENLVIGPTLIVYLKRHWDELMAGKEIPVRIGVPDRMEDFGFKFKKLKEEQRRSGPVVHVQLKPTSIFVSAVVDPIYFVFSKDGKKLLSTAGMSLLKVKKDGKWKDLMAETVFE